jgi:RNA polymerase sigma-70 factor, ECF subfamily
MSDATDETKFLQRLRARDERAFNELVRLYERRMYAVVFRMLGRRDEAEDLVQEVFVQVFKAIDQFRGDSKLSTWLYRIAINLCKNRVKYLSRRHANDQDTIEDMAERVSLQHAKGVTTGDINRPDEVFDGHEMEHVIRRCLAEIESDFREVLILRDIEGLSYEEIGQILSLAEGTVKSRLFRARAQLKALVEQAFGEKIA